ncbi:MAG: hypothetical protein Q8M16_21895 [Pirellulaceae bacterium]|nr:hypothetical protein [Pirellulaceae bacterium]
MRRVCFIAVLCLSFAWTATLAAADDFLKFKLIRNGQPLEARVVQYDFVEQNVTLVSREGQELVVSISELGTPDKRLIVKALERQLFQKPSRTPEKNPAPNDLAANRMPGGVVGEPLVWHAKFKLAAEQARGGEAVDDDRPIVWFRVLGDLRGLM